MKPLTVLVALMLAGSGTNLHYSPLNASPRPMTPRDAGAVELFTSTRPTRPFADVAMIEGQQQSDVSFDNTDAVLRKMREEAGRRGCDGMVIMGGNDTVIGGGAGSQSTMTVRGYRATCIVYRN